MATYFEDFEGMGTGSSPTGWTRRMNDVLWTTNVETLYSQKVVDWENGGVAGGMSCLTADTPGSVSGAVEVAFNWRIPAFGNYPTTLAVIYGNVAGDAGYAVNLTAANTFALYRMSGGSPAATIGSVYSGLTISADTFYRCRFGVNASGDFSVAMWLEGDSEPSAQITGNDTTITSGFVGMSGLAYNNLARYGFFGIGTGGDQAPLTGGGGSSPVLAASHNFRKRRAA